MNKKTLNSILLISVLAIWGYVLYSKFYNGETVLSEDENLINNTPVRSHIKKDSFELRANYRDPFLGKASRPVYKPKKNQGKSTQINRKKKPPLKKTEQVWPTIRYYGLVKNASRKKSGTALISINGKTHHVNNGEKVDNIEVRSIQGDSIKVKFNKELKTFYSRKKIQLQ